MSIDPYAALGLAKDAAPAQIKAAWRMIVRRDHPDLHPDDAKAGARFKAMSAAHDLLKDPETRRRFDAGEIDAAGAQTPPRGYHRDQAESGAHGFWGGRTREGGENPADIFAEMLRRQRGGQSGGQSGGQTGGQRGGQGFAARGGDARYTLDVPFLDAARGHRTRITLPDGAALEVAIPSGATDGQTLRLRGRGAPGFGGGPAGDALITLTVAEHSVFRREGADIRIILPITIDEAVLGARVPAPTIDGPVTVTIPKSASGGRILRLRGRGVKIADAPPGDQLIELRIEIPEGDPALTAFLQGWAEGRTHDPRKELLKEARS
jgi:DnaJ-class molecular chaperone